MGNNLNVHFDEDTKLMLKVVEGDYAAYDNLYRKYYHILLSYLTSRNGHQVSPEDLVQEAFARIWQNKEKFQGNSTFKTYLFGFAKRILLEVQKRQFRETTRFQELPFKHHGDFSVNLSQPESKTHQAEIMEKVEDAMSQLTVQQSQAIKLFYNSGITKDKAVKLANCSSKAYECRLSRAQKRLRQILLT